MAFIASKGGAGKTTMSINLAVTAEILGRSTVLIDIDPQNSSEKWYDKRKLKYPELENPVVISAQASRLGTLLDTARNNGADLTIIDTAPHSETSALAAARAADLVVIPCRPSLLDLEAISTTIDLAALSKTPAVGLLNAVAPKGSLADGAANGIFDQYGLEVCPTHIVNRVAFVNAFTSRQGVIEFEPKGKASDEIKALYIWLCDRLNAPLSKQERKLQ